MLSGWVSSEKHSAEQKVADHGEDDHVEAPAKKKNLNVLPSLIVVSALSAGTVCSVRADCSGCSECAAMFCTECQLGGETNVFVKGG